MKFIHLSDLHLGKRVNEFPMIEDQQYILAQILNAIDGERPDAVVLAGDIYDKTVPSTEAVQLFDDFLVGLAERKLQTFVISGNHDSSERLAFANRLIDASGVHLSSVYSGKITPVTLKDAFGEVDIYMLPFIKPAHVRRFFPEEPVETYTDAVRLAVREMKIDPEKRNVLIAHQFVTGASRSDSEEVSVGGLDNVDASAFEGFDYVALGHIHSPQNVGTERIRYAGTPLKYSFSEAKDQKSVTVFELKEKGALSVRTVPLVPLHDLKEIKGAYDEVVRRSFYEHTTYPDDYLHITLTDERDVPDAMAKLRTVYPRLMTLSYDNTRTRAKNVVGKAEAAETKTPEELFAELYEKQNGSPMTEEERAFLKRTIAKIWEEEV